MALRCSWRFLVPRMYSEHSDAKIMKCNRYLKQNFPLKPLLQGELILSRCSLPYELPFPDTEVSRSVFIAQNQPLRCLGAGTPCRSQPLTPFIDRLGIGLVSLRHAEMALEYLWGGSPCRRPARSPLRHDGMPLEYLWAWSPCRRPVGSSSSPRRDATEVPVGRVAVPKTVQKPPSPRRDATEMVVEVGSVPKTGQKNALPRDNLYPMGAARFPCAPEHTPL